MPRDAFVLSLTLLLFMRSQTTFCVTCWEMPTEEALPAAGLLSFGSLLDGEKGRIHVPVPADLMEHPKGRVLFDSGMHCDAGRDPGGRYQHIAKFHETRFEPNEDIAARLAAVDVDAGKISLMVNSDLHYDHAVAMRRFPTDRSWCRAGNGKTPTM